MNLATEKFTRLPKSGATRIGLWRMAKLRGSNSDSAIARNIIGGPAYLFMGALRHINKFNF